MLLTISGARRVLDLRCGEGNLPRELLRHRQFERIMCLDVSIRNPEAAQWRLKVDRLPTTQAKRLKLIHGSAMYRDKRLEGFDAAAVAGVVEPLDPPRLSAFEQVLFEFAQPRTVVLTTPNREYNVTGETLPAGHFAIPTTVPSGPGRAFRAGHRRSQDGSFMRCGSCRWDRTILNTAHRPR